MSKAPAWKQYGEQAANYIPRLRNDDAEMEHRCRMLWARDWANNKRQEVKWSTDQALYMINSLVSAYALNTQVRPDQAKALWESVAKLLEIAAALQASDLS